MTRALAAAGALALLASLWLPFYDGGVEGAYFNRSVDEPAVAGVSDGVSAWQAWTVLDVVVALLAVVALVAVLRRAGRVAAAAGAVAALVVGVRLVWRPRALDADDGVVFGALDRLTDLRLEPAWGAWVALAAALVTAAAAIRTARRLAADAEP